MRVYQRLDAFAPSERDRLRSMLDSGGRPESAAAGQHALGLIAAAERREVFERVVDGVRFVCPARTRLRSLLSMMTFTRTVPEGAAEVFFTAEEMEAARRELDSLQAREPELRPHMLQSAWHVPLRWFVCFDDAERRIEQVDDHPTVRYETKLAEALVRSERALEVLKTGIVHPVVVGMVHELHQWLGGFERSALLELDYASVSRLFDPDELADDHSAADVSSAIAALAQGDGMRAGLHYQRANERWAPKRTHESLN